MERRGTHGGGDISVEGCSVERPRSPIAAGSGPTNERITMENNTTSKDESRSDSCASPCSADLQDDENAFLKKINEAKAGKLIKVRLWTEECHSSTMTSAKSVSAAVAFIRAHSKFHANWSVEFISEPNSVINKPGSD